MSAPKSNDSLAEKLTSLAHRGFTITINKMPDISGVKIMIERNGLKPRTLICDFDLLTAPIGGQEALYLSTLDKLEQNFI